MAIDLSIIIIGPKKNVNSECKLDFLLILEKEQSLMSISIDDICGLAVAIGQYSRRKFMSMSAGYHKVNECIEIRISLNAITVFQ